MKRSTVSTVVIVAKDRRTNRVQLRVIANTDRETLRDFAVSVVQPGARVFTDEHSGYNEIPFERVALTHSAGEYVRGEAHTNGIESFWATIKRTIMGTFHSISVKHLRRYLAELVAKHAMRALGLVDRMAVVSRNMAGRRLRYRDMVA